MGRWFRVHDDLVDDPKVQLLSGDLVKALLNLWCLASQNDGVLPSMKDMAFKLRMKPQQVAAVIAELSSAGLIDRNGDEYRPHNWDRRQYKADATDPTNASRQKRYREKHRNAVTTVTDAVTDKRPYTEQKQTTEQIDKIGDGASAFTEGSRALASALWKALGYTTALSIPPELAGTDWRAIEWERAGWTVDLIDAEARRIGPGKPLVYYEKVFATSFAKRQAPLPVVEVKEAEHLTVTHGRRIQETNSLVNAARKHAEQGISFGPRPELPTLRSITGGADVRLLPQSGGDGPGDLCGGSGGGTERLSAGGD